MLLNYYFTGSAGVLKYIYICMGLGECIKPRYMLDAIECRINSKYKNVECVMILEL